MADSGQQKNLIIQFLFLKYYKKYLCRKAALKRNPICSTNRISLTCEQWVKIHSYQSIDYHSVPNRLISIFAVNVFVSESNPPIFQT